MSFSDRLGGDADPTEDREPGKLYAVVGVELYSLENHEGETVLAAEYPVEVTR